MSTLQELLEQRKALERQIAEAQRSQRSEAIATIRGLMQQHGLSVADLSASPRAARSAGAKEGKPASKVAAKFRNPATGDSWSGRGLQPKWLKAALAEGKQLDDFRIADAA